MKSELAKLEEMWSILRHDTGIASVESLLLLLKEADGDRKKLKDIQDLEDIHEDTITVETNSVNEALHNSTENANPQEYTTENRQNEGEETKTQSNQEENYDQVAKNAQKARQSRWERLKTPNTVVVPEVKPLKADTTGKSVSHSNAQSKIEQSSSRGKAGSPSRSSIRRQSIHSNPDERPRRSARNSDKTETKSQSDAIEEDKMSQVELQEAQLKVEK